MSNRVEIQLSDEEKAELAAAAKRSSIKLATFIRVMALRAVRAGQ